MTMIPDEIMKQGYFSTSVGNFYLNEAQPGTPLTSVTLKNGTTTRLSYDAAMYYQTLRSHSKLGTLSDAALLDFAKTQANMKTSMTSYQMSILGQKYGIPLEWWNTAAKTGGGGGGGGPSKEDQIRSLFAIINDEAAKFGIPLSADEITYIAGVAQKQNWGSAQIVDAITAKLNFANLQAGTIKASIDAFTAASKNYLVPISTETMNQWAAKLARGETTEDAVMSSIREAAKAANPWLATYIDQGLSPTDVLAPSRDFIAQALEINPFEIDLMNSKDMSMFTKAGADGQLRMANQQELTKTVRTDQRWKSTNNAREMTTSIAGLLSKVFGRSAF